MPLGGGIVSSALLGGPSILVNSTVTGNTALSDGGNLNAQGGLVLQTTLLSNGSPVNCAAESGAITSLGHNLDSDDSCGLTGAGDLIGVDPLLGSLQDNGGPTETHALLSGSPATDAGSAQCTDSTGAPLLTDQRGAARPVDGNGDGIIACDIGSYEVQPSMTAIDIDIKPANENNIVNPRSRGGIWVAILSDTDSDHPFDPSSQVDISTIKFGPDGAEAIRQKVKDINKDGLGDLLLCFKIPKTGITCGDTEATLTGETFDGQSFSGTDSIKTVGCKSKKHHKKHK